jgi:hypothetical protein
VQIRCYCIGSKDHAVLESPIGQLSPALILALIVITYWILISISKFTMGEVHCHPRSDCAAVWLADLFGPLQSSVSGHLFGCVPALLYYSRLDVNNF